MSVVPYHPAPAPEWSATALLRHLEERWIEPLCSGEGPLPGAGPRFGRLLRRGTLGVGTAVRRGSAARGWVRIRAGFIEGIASPAVREGEQRGPAHVLGGDDAARLPGGQSAGGLRGHQVAAQTVYTELCAQGGYLVERLFGEMRDGEPFASLLHAAGKLRVGGEPFCCKALRVGFVAQAAADYLDPLLRVEITGDLDRDPEPVQELRPELALLRVHRPDQDEARRVPDAHPLALHVVRPHRRHVEQEVHEMIREQVHLVHVQDAPVRRREKTRLERLLTLRESSLDVQSPREPVRARPHWQLHEPHRTPLPGRALQVRSCRTLGVRALGVRGVRATGDDLYGRQELREPPHGGGLRGPLLAAYQHAPDLRGDSVQEQCELGILLVRYGGEGVRGVQVASSSSISSFSR